MFSLLSGLIRISTSYPYPYVSLISLALPKQTNSPLTIIPILLHKVSASSIEWVVITTLLFSEYFEIL